MKHFVSVLLAAAFAAAPLAARAEPLNRNAYLGKPDLALTAAMVEAGGGPAHFRSDVLFAKLTGPLASAELASLRSRFGARAVREFFPMFDYAVNDSLRIATKAGVKLPAPRPNPADGKALAVALYQTGLIRGEYDPGTMLERMITHPIHMRVMRDIDNDAAYGPSRDASWHILLTAAMHDLAKAYG